MDARDFFGYKHADEEPGKRAEDEDAPDADRPPLPEEAITLDDPAAVARIDVSDMLGKVRALPRQLVQGHRIGAAATLEPRHRDVDAVLVLAMGGSAIGGDVVAGIAGSRLRVPLVVQRDYELPSWANERTLVVAASHSGETVETLHAAGEARERSLPLVVISTGGELGRQAIAAGTPFLRYESGGSPRAAIGFGVGILHELLVGAGLIADPDPIGPAVETLDALLERNAPGVETDANPAKQLAWAMFGRIPVVYGAGPMTAVARRWKTQLNENTKSWAMFEPMPEANHNTIEGSRNPRELSDALYVVQVRDPSEPTEIAARYRA
ncbi:MAG: hypothetical protein M3P14_03535, partial [Chloroflexota bacterium]|nr:hypothetical protein [Chloroflexota bacterium]